MRILLLTILFTIAINAQSVVPFILSSTSGAAPPAGEDTVDELNSMSLFTNIWGTWTQGTGEVYSGDNTDACMYRTSWTGNDQKAQVILSIVGSAYNMGGVAVRASGTSGSNATYYLLYANSTGTTDKTQLGQYVNGTWTSIGNYSNEPSINDTLKLQIVGTTLTAWLNSTQLYSGTQSDISTGKPGVCAYGNYGGTISRMTKFIATVK
jgi:hypothetical protein